MEYILSRDDFQMNFYNIGFFKSDIAMGAPINGTIRVSVKSDKYSAKSYLDLNYNKLATSYKERVSFFNGLAKQTIEFCNENNIEYHIKEGTLNV